ncbi:MAG TPA: hypothetical protein VFY10_07765 [Dehalococcoidia bacterium]|nr:hypothetical protein [Dehalococcoidia bacterium]
MPPWAPFPGLPETGTLFLEAFGELTRDREKARASADDQDLYSVFMTRAELMGWSTTQGKSSSPRFAPVWERPLLWGMNEAELTEGTDTSCIGYVQVGLEEGVEAAMVLPALSQCFDDSLRRFGRVDLSALQVTAAFLPRARPCAGNLISALSWFHAGPKVPADAVIAVDYELLRAGIESDFVASLQQMYTGPFVFGSLVDVPQQQSIDVRWGPAIHPGFGLSPARRGLSVTLPEWTASAAAWALALVIDELRVASPEVRNFAARVTRV